MCFYIDINYTVYIYIYFFSVGWIGRLAWRAVFLEVCYKIFSSNISGKIPRESGSRSVCVKLWENVIPVILITESENH